VRVKNPIPFPGEGKVRVNALFPLAGEGRVRGEFRDAAMTRQSDFYIDPAETHNDIKKGRPSGRPFRFNLAAVRSAS